MKKRHKEISPSLFPLGTDAYGELLCDPPAQAHSETSQEAAAAIKPRLNELHQLVLDFLRTRGDGATDEEMQDGIPMVGSTERPRRIELWRAGLVRDTGRKRKTKSGYRATIWELT